MLEDPNRYNSYHIDSKNTGSGKVLHYSWDIAERLNQLLALSLKNISLQKLLEEALDLILSIPWLVFKSKGSIFLLENDHLVMKAQRGLEEPLQEECRQLPMGRCLCGEAASTGRIQFASTLDRRHEIYYPEMEPHGHYCLPIRTPEKIYGVLNLYLHEGHRRDEKEEEFLIAFTDALAGIIVRRQAEEALQQSEKNLMEIFNNSRDAVYLHDLDGTIIEVNPAACERLGYSREELIGRFITDFISSEDALYFSERSKKLQEAGQAIFEFNAVTRTENIIPVEVNAALIEYEGKMAVLSAARDITERKEVEKTLNEMNEVLEKRVRERTSELTRVNRELQAEIEQRVRTEDSLRKRIAELEALRKVSFVLRTAGTLNEMLNLLLNETLKTFNTDVGAIWVAHSSEERLRFFSARGWVSRLDEAEFKPDQKEGIIRRVYQTGEHHISREVAVDPLFKLTGNVEIPRGWGGIFMPLFIGDKTVGILFVAVPLPREISSEETKLLNSLAEMAGTAIHRFNLYEDLQQANQELVQAYDATIESLACSLEIRDYETEGHCRRVAEWTVQLARAMGIPEERLIHVYRGALLHDIGKMGISDHILLKPGPLTEEEWGEIYQHPQYAHDLLSRVEYLQPAINIPYCHHEKFDGSGYPRGLKGEEIPLEARIFAVLDVYDALTSDRPYRKAWSKESALKYIQEESGSHFDIQVVEVFLQKGGF